MEAWRDVEVAACEEMDGPTRRTSSRRSARATFTVEAVKERERITDHDVAAFVDVLSASAGAGGRWIHFGLTSSDVLDTALALQLRAAGELIVPARARARRALAERAREHARHALRRAHARRARRADDVRHQARGLRLRGAPQRAAAGAGVRAGLGRRDLRRGRDVLGDRRRSSRRACWRARACEREPVSTQVVPRDRHAELLQAIALAGAGLERFATEIRHLQRTEVREVEEPFRAGPEGLVGDAAQAQPDHVASGSPGSRACCAATRRPAVENVALWHERDISHSVGRARDPARRDDPDRLHAVAARCASCAGMVVARRAACARTSTHARRAVLPARAAGARGQAACRATTPTASRRSTRSARGTRRTPLRSLLEAEPAVARRGRNSRPSQTTPSTSAMLTQPGHLRPAGRVAPPRSASAHACAVYVAGAVGIRGGGSGCTPDVRVSSVSIPRPACALPRVLPHSDLRACIQSLCDPETHTLKQIVTNAAEGASGFLRKASGAAQGAASGGAEQQPFPLDAHHRHPPRRRRGVHQRAAARAQAGAAAPSKYDSSRSVPLHQRGGPLERGPYWRRESRARATKGGGTARRRCARGRRTR